ncbi:putative PKS/NRPS-like protein biosynthetic cluster [Aspergillus niger]|nr:putative PKS/NRPS-like protein biosynthetic cluster [Aspergillus niger]GLA12789.1 putative PKS/NRPS-like protein biosynthetic cluster [Aspergillus niger]
MSEASELQSLISHWRSQLPPINGIVDSTYCMGPSNQPVATRPTSSPIDIVMELLNLHNAIPSVEFFIMISPISGLTGRDNDSDFSAARAFQDALVRHRLSHGMHAASVNVRDMKDEEVLAAVDYMTDIRNPPTVDSCQMVCNVPTPASYEEVEKPVARYLSAPLFHQLPSFRSRVASMPTESARRPSVADLLNKTNNTEQAAAVVSREIRQKLSHLLNVTEDEINELHDVRTNGVDSLIEMEFRNWLDRELGTTISLEDLTSKSILKLSAHVVTASPLVSFT